MKLALVAPAATVTLDGTVATLVLLLDRATTAPPDGAALLSVTVPIDELPPLTLVGLSVSEIRLNALTHILFVQVWPEAQVPQLSVPPQPSEALPQVNPREEQVAGVHVVLVVQMLFVQVWPEAQVPQLSVPPQPSGTLPQLNPSEEQVAGVQPPVTVSGAVSGDCPGAPSLTLMLTVVCVETELAAWRSSFWAYVQAGWMNGCALGMTETTLVLLLVTEVWTPVIGAMCDSVTPTNAYPPGAMLVGLISIEAIGGGAGAVPPVFRVSGCWRPAR